MLLILKRSFKMRRVLLAKLIFPNQVTIHEQFNGIVQGGPRNTVFLNFHSGIQGFNIKVSVQIIDFFEDSKSFWRFSVTVFLQVGSKNTIYFLLQFFRSHRTKIGLSKLRFNSIDIQNTFNSFQVHNEIAQMCGIMNQNNHFAFKYSGIGFK